MHCKICKMSLTYFLSISPLPQAFEEVIASLSENSLVQADIISHYMMVGTFESMFPSVYFGISSQENFYEGFCLTANFCNSVLVWVQICFIFQTFIILFPS